jgi:hypothetical protein
VDALDALLGTASPRGDLVRVGAAGVHTNRDDLDLPDRPTDVDPCTPHRHGKLRGNQRCYGCGRTRNEIEIDEGG